MFETIDFSKSKQYTLSIRLSADGFSFSIYNPLEEGQLSVEEQEVDPSLSLTANLKRSFRDLEFLKHSYKRVHILLVGKRFTLVPLELFDDEQVESIFHYNHPEIPNEIVLYNIQKRHNTVVIYGMDKSAHSFLVELFPDATFFSQASPMLEYFLLKSRIGNSRKIYAHLRTGAIELYAYDRGKLLFANSFECSEIADRTYYILYVWKLLEFDQQRDELQLAGLLTNKDALLKELRKFISQVFVMNPEANIDIQGLLSCE